MIKIKDFSNEVEFSIRMLRYLEEVGVLIPKRDSNNYRIYSKSQIREANKIKKMQVLGLQLKEIEILQSSAKSKQIRMLEDVLSREKEISEIKSESIPELRCIIDLLRQDGKTLDTYFYEEKLSPQKLNIIGNENKVQRVAYSIPILRNIYEDHLTNDANIDLIATDLIKFNIWFEHTDYVPNVFSVLNDTTFVFGRNITKDFLKGYESAWNKYLPAMGFTTQKDFSKEDIGQLMGPHDILIRTMFKYKDSGIDGEVVIP